MKQFEILSAQAQGNILTMELANMGIKRGADVTVGFRNDIIEGIVIEKLGKRVKVRINKIYKKLENKS